MSTINYGIFSFSRLCINTLVGKKFYCSFHQRTVLVDAVLDVFSPKSQQVFADFTFGSGGHSQALLTASKDVKVFALDRDPIAHALACQLASKYSNGQLVPLLGLFSDIPSFMMEHDIPPDSFDGILIETGPSGIQLEDSQRGFNWERDGPLDMRMDAQRIPGMPTASDVINSLDSVPLSQILKKYGEEKHAKKIAKALVDARYLGTPVETTKHLSQVVSKALGTEFRTDVENRQVPSCHKVFQSLRMFVNNELNELNYALHVAHRYLKPGGKLVTITYNPREDLIVKKHLMGVSMHDPKTDNVSLKFVNTARWFAKDELLQLLPDKWSIVHRKVQPKVEEISLNPMSSFAKLRAACKTDLAQKNKKEAIVAKLYF